MFRWLSRWLLRAEVAEAKYNDAVKLVHEQSGRIAELRATLDASEKERREAQLQLLRAFNDLPIFPEQVAQAQAEAALPPEVKPLQRLSFAEMPEAEINALLVREAKNHGCQTMSQITAYVNRRKKEVWDSEHTERLSDQDAALKKQALEAIEEAVMEGRAQSVAAIATEGN